MTRPGAVLTGRPALCRSVLRLPLAVWKKKPDGWERLLLAIAFPKGPRSHLGSYLPTRWNLGWLTAYIEECNLSLMTEAERGEKMAKFWFRIFWWFLPGPLVSLGKPLASKISAFIPVFIGTKAPYWKGERNWIMPPGLICIFKKNSRGSIFCLNK